MDRRPTAVISHGFAGSEWWFAAFFPFGDESFCGETRAGPPERR